MNASPSNARFDAAFAACPMIAILRGITPDEAEAVGDVLVEAGFTMIEVPLNSPDPFASIERLARRFGARAMIGAGTVIEPGAIEPLSQAGGCLAISPHMDPDIIARSRAAGLISIPGVLSASEAFAAMRAGAQALKLFPMEMIGAAGVKALRAVLPAGLRLIAVGGVDAASLPRFGAAGCDGFGVGGSLYRPGDRPADVAAKAAGLIEALHSRAG